MICFLEGMIWVLNQMVEVWYQWTLVIIKFYGLIICEVEADIA